MARSFLVIGVIVMLLVGVGAWSSSLAVAQNAAVFTATPTRSGIPPCPDTTRAITTATARVARTPIASPTGPITPRPTTIAVAGFFNVTQTAVFDVVHTIVEYDPGVVSTFQKSTGPVSLIVIDGEITLCSGNLQRVLKAGETWIIPENITYRLGNGGTGTARLSIVRMLPQTTPTAQPTGTATQVPQNQPPTNTPSGPAYLGIQVGAIDNTALRVLRVFDNSPAAAAQIRPDDVITALDGTPLASLVAGMNPPADSSGAALVEAFFNQISAKGSGAQITLTIQRGNDVLNVTLTLTTAPQK